MWKSSDIHDDVAYVVQLCQGVDGVRYARLRDVENDAELGEKWTPLFGHVIVFLKCIRFGVMPMLLLRR